MNPFTTLTSRAVALPVDNIDTDQIYPGRFLDLVEPQAIGKHAMEGADPEFIRNFKSGDIIVAAANFGCGSSREHAVITLLAAGVGAIVAESYGRIFYRNAINIGLPLLEVGDAVKRISAGDVLSVDLESGEIVNSTTGETIQATPLPGFIQDIAAAGGLINYVKGTA